MKRIVNIIYCSFSKKKDPPQVQFNIQEVSYSKLTEDIQLECQSICANPSSNLVYKWTNPANQVIDNVGNKYTYRVQAQSTNDVFKVTCLISNGIESPNKDQSTIVFNITYKSDDTSSTSGNFLPIIS